MKRSRYMMAIGALLTLRVATMPAQGSADGGTWGFVNMRYDPRSSASMYTGYGWRHGFAMGGLVQNPTSGYTEILGGAGAAFRTGARAEHWLAYATARTGATSSAVVYWLPTVRTGWVTSRAIVKWTAPYKGSVAQKLSITPLSLLVPLRCRLSAGPAMELSATEGKPTSVGTGVELRLKLARAGVGADALRDVRGGDSRLRLFFASRF